MQAVEVQGPARDYKYSAHFSSTYTRDYKYKVINGKTVVGAESYGTPEAEKLC